MDEFFKEHAVHFSVRDPRSGREVANWDGTHKYISERTGMDDLEDNLNNIVDYTKFFNKLNWTDVWVPKYRPQLPEIKKIYFNKPYTIIIWDTGEKTIVKCAEGDTYSKEMGVLLAIRKYEMGNKSATYFRSLQKLIKEKGVENNGK